MTSLFISFDLKIFFVNSFLFLMFMIFFNPLCVIFFSSVFSLLLSFVKSFIGGFLNSLSSSNFSKGMDYLHLFVFIFIFFLNIFSIFPFIFPFSSQPSMVLFISLGFWVSLYLFSFFNNFQGQLSHLIPEGSPFNLAILLFVIELVSGLIRPITLSIRLVANILAGHLLIILLSSLVQYFGALSPLLSILNSVEIFVALIQSYILVTLLSLYYSEM